MKSDSDDSKYISQMVAPSQKRPGAYLGGIIQIHVTRACDKACRNCTQGSNLRGKATFMPPDLFEKAVSTLVDFWGVVGVFGGNPALSPFFADYCEILKRTIPKYRCGLWCNKLFGKGKIASEAFNPAHSNFNVHMDREAFDEFVTTWPGSNPFGIEDSHHSSPWVALKDVQPDEIARWEAITNCDINRNWSSMIGMFRGELRAWFCEIAGAQSILHQDEPSYPDTGHAVVDGWWRKPIEEYSDQVRFHCHQCGIPLKMKGELAIAGTKNQVSLTHLQIYRPKQQEIETEVIDHNSASRGSVRRVTDYVRNAT